MPAEGARERDDDDERAPAERAREGEESGEAWRREGEEACREGERAPSRSPRSLSPRARACVGSPPGFLRHLENPAARCPSRLGVFSSSRQNWTCGKKCAKCIKTFECNKATEPPPFYARRFAAYFDQKFECAAEAWAPADDGAAAEAPAAANGSGADDVFVDVDAEAPPPLPEGAARSDSEPETPASQPMCGTDIAALCLPK